MAIWAGNVVMKLGIRWVSGISLKVGRCRRTCINTEQRAYQWLQWHVHCCLFATSTSRIISHLVSEHLCEHL